MESFSGLTSVQATQSLRETGPNEIPEKKTPLFVKIFKQFFSPISLMLLLASGLSFVSAKTFDGYFILTLLLLNIGVSAWQEAKADNAIAKLNENLKSRVRTFRDGQWQDVDTRELVPEDIIQLTAGEIVPADGLLIDNKNVSVNESALTGESLPNDKNLNDALYSGSFIATGIATLKITATGKNTKFGKVIFSVETQKGKSFLETDIIRISKFLSALSLIGVAVLSVFFILQHAPVIDLLTLDLSLIIAGIPVSLPTVMTLIIALGVLDLSKKQVVVRRLSALEDLANVNLLLTDKTGTLTENKIVIDRIIPYNYYTDKNVIADAYLASYQDSRNLISQAIISKAGELAALPVDYTVYSFVPGDSVKKRTTAQVKDGEGKIYVTAGASQVILDLCALSPTQKNKVEKDIADLGQEGYRSLAVATGKEEKEMTLVGLLALSDELRPEASDVIQFLTSEQIEVAMVTGDNRVIAGEIAKKLAIPGNKIITRSDLEKTNWQGLDINFYRSVQAFAEIYPEDKLRLVQDAKKYFVVATNGDGVNDLPAVKAANVGFAVENAVIALKEAADIVLLSNGISVIKDAIIESRKIFSRLYSYSVYRLSESFRLIVTIVILGLIYKSYPLTPLQIILIALLNDIPIISLAYDRVENTTSPAKLNIRKRFILSSLYGLVGVANSLILFFLLVGVFHISLPVVQTIYFLKLTVSGHLLIYVAHTKQRWWKFLPSNEVIIATTLTQLVASLLAFTGWFMPAPIPLVYILGVWLWAIFWMQVSEAVKAAKTV
ncbi:plasma-membrane proton-efflux P-type ATPase [Patescibacteria group bacterium]|nr:plasma-membrane proton-efflux P-type ATPase [Patescibacteria group bacterium]